MVYKQYQSPFENMPANAVQPEHRDSRTQRQERTEQGCCPRREQCCSPFGFLSRIKLDDIIILGLIIILLTEEREKRDLPTIMALGFLFLIEYIER